MKRQGLTRRRVVAAGALAATGAVLLAARPADRGAPHTGNFATMAQALKAEGLGTQPTLVVDRTRLRANAAKVRAHFGVDAKPAPEAGAAKAAELPGAAMVAETSEGADPLAANPRKKPGAVRARP